VLIDCAVHPVLLDEPFNEAVGGPWNLLKLPTLYGDRYAAPFDQIGMPLEDAASPAVTAEHVLNRSGADYAILAPTTRGYIPNPQHAAAVARAANTLLHDEWLNAPEADGRFLGSIRVPLNDTAVALRDRDLGGRRQIRADRRPCARVGHVRRAAVLPDLAHRGRAGTRRVRA
jgi:hypothetical protein